MNLQMRKSLSLTLICYLVALSLLLNTTTVSAQSPWLEGWAYRKSHVINAQEGAETNYQISIVVHYGSGTDSGEAVYLNEKCKTDFADIRFTDDDQETDLDYWMETKTDSDTAVFWVEVADNLDASDVTIYVYYGNGDAVTISNGDETFIFFDNFLGDSLNLSKWIVREGDVSVSDNQLVLSGTSGTRGRIDGTVSFNVDSAIHARSKCSVFGGYVQLLSTRISDDDTLKDSMFVYVHEAEDRRFRTTDESLPQETIGIGLSPDVYATLEARWIANKAQLLVNGVLMATHTIRVPDEMQVYYFREGSVVDCDGYVDWLFVRKYVSPEPTHGSWGSEQPFNIAQWTDITTPYVHAAVSIMSLALIVGVGTAFVSSIESQDMAPLIPVIIVGVAIMIALFIALPILNAFSGL